MSRKIPTIDHVSAVLNGLYQSLGMRRIFASFFLGSGITLLGLWLTLLMESWLWMSPFIRTIGLTLSVIAGLSASLVMYIRIPRPDFTQLYRDVSVQRKLPELRYLMDLQRTAGPDRSSLHDAAMDQQRSSLNSQTLESEINAYRSGHEITGTLQLASFLSIIGLLLFGGFSVIEQAAFQRILTPSEAYFRPNPFTFSVSPGDSTLEQGTGQQIRVNFTSGQQLPEQVRLAFRTRAETDFRLQPMETESEGNFVSSSLQLFDNAEYYLLMDGYRSEVYELQVQLLPRFTDLQITGIPPAYTGIDTLRLNYPFSRVETYPGTEIQIAGGVNQPLSKIVINSTLRDSVSMSLQDDSSTYATAFTTTSSRDSLWFDLRESGGLQNRNTFSFEIVPVADQSPLVQLTEPESLVSLLEPSELEMAYEMEDDFGFSRIRLGYVVERSFGGSGQQTRYIALPTPSDRIATGQYTWNLSELQLLPLDAVRYWIEVTDNDAYSGFKTTRSAEQRVVVQSITENLLAQEEQENEVADQLRDFQQAYEQNRREFEDLRQQILQNEGDNWDQQQAAEDIRESREELSRQLDEITEQFEQLREDLADDNQLSQETKALYEDLQRLIEEIDDPAILEAMQKLQEGLHDMNMDQVRESMEQLEFDEERYQQRLERTLELFRDLQMNAELDRMNAILEDLAQQEESLIGDEIPSAQEQQQRQQQIQENLDMVRQKLEELPERSSRRNQQEISRLSEELQEQIRQTDQQLGEDLQQLQQGGEGSDQESQQRREEIRDQLESMQQQISQSSQMMGQESVQVNRRALLGLMQNLLLLSDAQEELVEKTGNLVQGSAGFVEAARDQRVISRSFSQITDSLFRVSAEVPRFPNLINDRKAVVQQHLDRAVQLLAERDRNRSVSEERTALGGINDIASMLADLLEQLDNMSGQGGGGGMSAEQLTEQLQQMSGEQARLNQMMQDMINDMAGERLMQDQMERLDQMARQQNEIRRQLRQLQQEGGFSPGDQLSSELERLAEQMEDAINDLRGGVTEERVLVQRQQNILSRMLQAERALNERDEDEERRGEEATDVERISPSELTLETLREEIERRMLQSDDTRFTREYQELIRQYFRILEEQERRRSAGDR